MGIISVQKPESVCLQSNLSALYSYLMHEVLFDCLEFTSMFLDSTGDLN